MLNSGVALNVSWRVEAACQQANRLRHGYITAKLARGMSLRAAACVKA